MSKIKKTAEQSFLFEGFNMKNFTFMDILGLALYSITLSFFITLALIADVNFVIIFNIIIYSFLVLLTIARLIKKNNKAYRNKRLKSISIHIKGNHNNIINIGTITVDNHVDNSSSITKNYNINKYLKNK